MKEELKMKKIISLLLILFLVGCNSNIVNLQEVKENHQKLNSILLQSEIHADNRVIEIEAVVINRNEMSVHNKTEEIKNYIKDQKVYEFKENKWNELSEVKLDKYHVLHDNLEMKSLLEFIMKNEQEVIKKKEKDVVILEWSKKEIEDMNFNNLLRTLIFKDRLYIKDKIINPKIRIEIKDKYIQFVECSGSTENEMSKGKVQIKLKQYNEDFSSKMQLRG